MRLGGFCRVAVEPSVVPTIKAGVAVHFMLPIVQEMLPVEESDIKRP